MLVCLVYACIPSQGTPSPLAPSQAASAISCMVSRILTSPGRHHSGVSLLVRRFAQKAIAVAMLKCKPLFLFILGPIILGLIRNPIWLDSGGLASSFSCQSAERLSDSKYWSVAFSASKYKKVGKSLGRFENNFWNFDFREMARKVAERREKKSHVTHIMSYDSSYCWAIFFLTQNMLKYSNPFRLTE